jgi:DNA-binding transcriptional regulator YhcF (GntR family)
MVQFFVDKHNKVPLYLQLTDEIRYYISTGVLGEREQLPPVKVLAKMLGINFLTVRKAYKELESAGLLDVRHGEGTFISLSNHGSRNGERRKRSDNSSAEDVGSQFADAARILFEQNLKRGLDLEEARKIVQEIFAAIERKSAVPRVVFAACNVFQIESISVILAAELNLEVEPVLIERLPGKINRWLEDGREIHIVTTGYHVDQVRKAIGEVPIQIDVLITNLDPKTRRKLEAVGEDGTYGFICRDKESAAVYKDLLKAELGYKKIHLTTCTFTETALVQSIINSSDVILVSPLVFVEVSELCPPGKSVFNVFDRVDPMSLKVVKDRILDGQRRLV